MGQPCVLSVRPPSSPFASTEMSTAALPTLDVSLLFGFIFGLLAAACAFVIAFLFFLVLFLPLVVRPFVPL